MASKADLVQFIALKWNDGDPVGDDESLIEGGIIDSLGLNVLAVFVEQTFGVRIKDTDLVEAEVGTVSRIMAYISRHQA